MFQKFVIAVCLIGLLLTVGCKTRSFYGTGPKPYASLEQYVIKTTHSWLDVRMDDINYLILTRPSNSWEEAETLEELSNWFADNFNNSPLFNFHSFILNIQETHHYTDLPPSESEFVEMLKEALRTFTFGEDNE